MLSIENFKNLFTDQDPEKLFQDCMNCIENNQVKQFSKQLKKLKRLDNRWINEFDDSNISLLKKSIICNNSEFVKILLNEGVNYNILDDNRQTPIFLSVINNRLTIFKTLLERNININQTDHKGNTLLHYAVYNMNLTMVSLLLQKGAYQDIKNTHDLYPIHLLLEHQQQNDIDITNFLLNSHLNYNLLNSNRNTLLHLSILNKQYNITKQLLLLDKLKINAVNFDNQTALDLALKYNYPENIILNFFERKDLDSSHKDKENNTALHKIIDLYNEQAILNIMSKTHNLNVNNINDRKDTEFSLAAKKGYLKVMRYMISHCHIVYEINNNGLSNALLSLLEKEKWEMATLIINKGANLLYTLNPDSYLIDYFTDIEKLEAVRFIINKLEQQKIPNEHFEALLKATLNNNPEIVNIILSTINTKKLYNNNLPFIHTAINVNSKEIVEALVNKGANILQRDDHNNTPLFHAIKHNKINIAEFLISKMLELDQECESGLTAFDLSIKNNLSSIFLALINKVNIKRINNEGLSPISLAIKKKNPLFVQQLLISGALERDKKYDGYDNRLTNLLQHSIYYAAGYGNKEILKILLDYGGNLNSYSTEDEEPPIHNAIKNKNIENVKFLIEENVKLQQYSLITGDSALHIAVRTGEEEILSLLLEDKEININIKSKIRGLTPLDLALTLNNDHFAFLLLQHGASVNTSYINDKHLKEYIIHNLVQSTQFLLSKGINLKLENNDIPDIIYTLNNENCLDWLKILHNNGINILEKDNDGNNIFDYLTKQHLLNKINDKLSIENTKQLINDIKIIITQ